MLKSVMQNYLDEACDDMDIGVIVRLMETGEEVAVSYDIVASIGFHGGLLIDIAVESQSLFDWAATADSKICDRCDNGGLEIDYFKARLLYDYTPVNPSPFIVLGFGNISLHNGNGIPFSIKTQSNRKDTIKAIIIYLSSLREEEKKDLDCAYKDLCTTEMLITSKLAVDALDEIIDMLEDVY